MKALFSFFLVIGFSLNVLADGLTIHAAEAVIGRFHRLDNKVHPYEQTNAWLPYVLADESKEAAGVVKNSDGSYTIFFSTLKELFQATVQVSKSAGQSVRVFNINAHGMPGGVWFPRDEVEMNSKGCSDWKQVAEGSDEVSYNQYYSAIGKDDILAIRQISKIQDASIYGCVNGLSKWQRTANEVPELKTVFAEDAQINFLSCTVGLGNAGERFTKGLGQALLGPNGVVRTSIKFGLGDWSMPQGMGFWDYVNDEQLAKDNASYPVDKNDSLIAQTGDIRVGKQVKGVWTTAISPNQSFMLLSYAPVTTLEEQQLELNAQFRVKLLFTPMEKAPVRVRVPGTTVYAEKVQ